MLKRLLKTVTALALCGALACGTGLAEFAMLVSNDSSEFFREPECLDVVRSARANTVVLVSSVEDGVADVNLEGERLYVRFSELYFPEDTHGDDWTDAWYRTRSKCYVYSYPSADSPKVKVPKDMDILCLAELGAWALVSSTDSSRLGYMEIKSLKKLFD